jgi:CRP/FNR family transcriptional regulator/CRP/FNR family cyclic AMP-dependent transcriptional regulator
MGQAPPLQDTPPGAVQDLAEKGSVREYRRGTYLFHQHDEAPSVYFLWRGRVEISSTSVTGHRQLHTTLEPPQFFGELGVLGEMNRTATAVALEDTTVCVIPGEPFVEFLSAHPESSRSLLRALARQIAEHEALVEDLLFLDLKGRVAKRLIGLCTPSLGELPDDGSVIPSVVTHADLAALAGGSRENVTRILSELQRRGLVKREGRRYALANVEGLRRLAGL